MVDRFALFLLIFSVILTHFLILLITVTILNNSVNVFNSKDKVGFLKALLTQVFLIYFC